MAAALQEIPKKVIRICRRWEESEDAILHEYYPMEGMDCIKRLNRGKAAIRSRAALLEIKHLGRRKPKDLMGKKFGKLMVIQRGNYVSYNEGPRRFTWLCKCTCGKDIQVRADHLIGGKVKSCGCSQMEHITKLGRSWRGKERPRLRPEIAGLRRLYISYKYGLANVVLISNYLQMNSKN